jgi:hypothetical protein
MLVLGVPAIAGGIPILLKIYATITVLFLLLGFYFGVGAVMEDSDVKTALAALSGLVALGGFIARQFMKYQRQSLKYQVELNDNIYYRNVNNFADDDLLLNTGVSFPISFHDASIRGTEVKLEIPRWGRLTGFLSYSNMLGVASLPITGGLFLGSDAAGQLNATGTFPISQDQRNTARGRFRYEVTPRFWLAFGGLYGSGLPVEFDGTYQDALTAYGPRIVNSINFERGRVHPNFSLNASAGVILWKKEKQSLRLQADVQNLTDRLNVINFAGLFSGTALGVPRSGAIRLQAEF